MDWGNIAETVLAFIIIAVITALIQPLYKDKAWLAVRYFLYDLYHCWGRKCGKCGKRIWCRMQAQPLGLSTLGNDEPCPYHAECNPNPKQPAWLRYLFEQQREISAKAFYDEKGRIEARDIAEHQKKGN